MKFKIGQAYRHGDYIFIVTNIKQQETKFFATIEYKTPRGIVGLFHTATEFSKGCVELTEEEKAKYL